jgi:hypothetical protein
MNPDKHREHLLKVDVQMPKAKGRCEHCGRELDAGKQDPRQLDLNLPEGSPALPRQPE